MNRSLWVVCFAILMQAMPSWGQSTSVIREGKEWLQPADFTGYTYNEVKDVCPDRACFGMLPGSTIDLTGFTWASVYEVSTLFNTYGATPPFTAPFQERTGDGSMEFLADFDQTGWLFGLEDDQRAPVTSGMVREPFGPERFFESDEVYAAFVVGGGWYSNTDTSASAEPGEFGLGVWFWRQVEQPPELPEQDFIVFLEEPIDLETHSGIGNLRGWAIAADGIDRVEIYIDGEYKFDAPYGGERTDVAEVYPGITDSNQSGFSLAFGYSNLGIGEHTLTARAFNNLGEYLESTATFEVVAFHDDFVNQWKIVDTSKAQINEQRGDEMFIGDFWIDGRYYELRLKWRSAEQGFELIEILEGR